MSALTSGSAAALKGAIGVPGDKSISHRALMMGALAVGETRIDGLLEAEDVLATAAALGAMGVDLHRDEGGRWRARGVGVGGLTAPPDVLDMGNSGTSTRLLLGMMATHDLVAHVTGDASLRRRPMARVTEPLSRMGATFETSEGGRLPLLIRGAADPLPIDYVLPVPSAQVKSAVLLAGLNAPGETSVTETQPSRDHTERLLRHVGIEVRTEQDGGKSRITVAGYQEAVARDILVPGDPSSAAFPGVAALLVPGSEVTLQGVGVNPLRAGLFATLREMGADIGQSTVREEGGEPVADLVFRFSRLKGVDVPAGRAPAMIDEYPVLAVAAAFAEGRTRMAGLTELRFKESDRLAAIVAGLNACGVSAVAEGDDLIVDGAGGSPPGGATVASDHDHRIAMAFLVFGLAARKPVVIDDARPIATSFPGFVPLMNGLGAAIGEADVPA